MSSILKRLKSAAEQIPEPIGRYLTKIPFSWRLGHTYTRFRREIERFPNGNTEQERAYIFERVRRITRHAYLNVPFYKAYYNERDFHPGQLNCFNDLQKIPVVTKSDLRNTPLSERSVPERGRMQVNTGGTTGEPLNFYLDANAFAREWAHMHHIWETLGYDKTDLKLTFRGKNIGDQAYAYNVVHNEYTVNGYRPLSSLSGELLALAEQKNIRYLHGYPSAIYEFARYCKSACPKLAEVLKGTLKGVLLGSEYPAPVYREKIEHVFDTPTLSWYGHSEMAILAYEEHEPFVYGPMHTYGYCEAIPDGSGEYRLVGTAYRNTASPFIRYDTGDRVDKVKTGNGLLREFQIATGRIGDFIVDKKGHRISLTALIFGRHHEIFNWARFVQVRQVEPGEATVVVTRPMEEREKHDNWSALFDSSDVDIEFDFEVRNEPVRTSEGKVKLFI